MCTELSRDTRTWAPCAIEAPHTPTSISNVNPLLGSACSPCKNHMFPLPREDVLSAAATPPSSSPGR